jgi:hypothetical protein
MLGWLPVKCENVKARIKTLANVLETLSECCNIRDVVGRSGGIMSGW